MSIATFNEPASQTSLLASVLALLNGPTGLGGMSTPRRAYDMGSAPKTGGDYVAVTLTRTLGGNRRVGGGIAPSSWYLTTMAVGSVNNVSVLLRRCTLALEGVEFTAEGVTSTALQFSGQETPAEQDEDDLNLWTATRLWTFAF